MQDNRKLFEHSLNQYSLKEKIVLQRIQDDGEHLTATFLPRYGMNLCSLKKGDREYIDISTFPLFEERMAGLGALIGPHFYHRKEEDIPHIPDETIFPFLKNMRSQGIHEPFSHGIGRYVPWNVDYSDLTLKANLSGLDTISGITLSQLEGFNFALHFKAHLSSNGLVIDYSVESDKPSVVGLHYYLALDDHQGHVELDVQDEYFNKKEWKSVPPEWKQGPNHLNFNLDNEADYTFLPLNPKRGLANLMTSKRKLAIEAIALSDELSFQLYHPENASYVCIEPISAKNPRDVKLKKSHIQVHFQFIPFLETTPK